VNGQVHRGIGEYWRGLLLLIELCWVWIWADQRGRSHWMRDSEAAQPCGGFYYIAIPKCCFVLTPWSCHRDDVTSTEINKHAFPWLLLLGWA
jgi:hypothetical protein